MKYALSIFSIAIALWAFNGCTKKAEQNPTDDKPSPVVTPSPAKTEVALSWEKNHPERKHWSTFISELLSAELFESFDASKDAARICHGYAKLSQEQKLSVWGELISSVAYFESGWNPASRMTETTMGTDPVTGKQVVSEGLLQLSYQDVPNYGSLLKYPLCKIDWSKDKSLASTDLKKTILDPTINLECGLRILANQISKKGYVILSSGVYWAVLKDGGKYSKVDSIISMVRKTGLCE